MTPEMLLALRDPAERETIRAEVLKKTDYENYVYNCGGFSGVNISTRLARAVWMSRS